MFAWQHGPFAQSRRERVIQVQVPVPVPVLVPVLVLDQPLCPPALCPLHRPPLPTHRLQSPARLLSLATALLVPVPIRTAQRLTKWG